MQEAMAGKSLDSIELLAGKHPNGELIVERVQVAAQGEVNTYLLLKSPAFVRGVARGDLIQCKDTPKGSFTVLKHAGNLSVRIFSKEANEAFQQDLSSQLEKLGGDLDIHESRILVYSIHVSCGFNEVEKILEALVAKYSAPGKEINWLYGNVYDPETGEPLNWWQAILSPE